MQYRKEKCKLTSTNSEYVKMLPLMAITRLYLWDRCILCIIITSLIQTCMDDGFEDIYHQSCYRCCLMTDVCNCGWQDIVFGTVHLNTHRTVTSTMTMTLWVVCAACSLSFIDFLVITWKLCKVQKEHPENLCVHGAYDNLLEKK